MLIGNLCVCVCIVHFQLCQEILLLSSLYIKESLGVLDKDCQKISSRPLS